MGRLWRWLTSLFKRPPDFIVGGAENPYMLRWHLIPRNRWLNIYLHKFMRSDDDRCSHDHPWRSLSILLQGEYIEVHRGRHKLYKAGTVITRDPYWDHQIIIPPGQTCWTLFITGPKVREWGFWQDGKWIHNEEYRGEP